MVSARYTYRRSPFFTRRMLINTSDSMANNKTVKLSIIIRGWLCCQLLPYLSPFFFCHQKKRSIFMDFWKYITLWLFVVGSFYTVCTKSQRRVKEKESTWKAFISSHFDRLDVGPEQRPCSSHILLCPSFIAHTNTHSCMYTNIETCRQM